MKGVMVFTISAVVRNGDHRNKHGGRSWFWSRRLCMISNVPTSNWDFTRRFILISCLGNRKETEWKDDVKELKGERKSLRMM